MTAEQSYFYATSCITLHPDKENDFSEVEEFCPGSDLHLKLMNFIPNMVHFVFKMMISIQTTRKSHFQLT